MGRFPIEFGSRRFPVPGDSSRPFRTGLAIAEFEPVTLHLFPIQPHDLVLPLAGQWQAAGMSVCAFETRNYTSSRPAHGAACGISGMTETG